MKIIFMGSAELACNCLDLLRTRATDDLVAIVTQPDRPRGRKLRLQPCPAREHVMDWGIPMLTPENVNTPESVAELQAFDADLVVVVAYGQILRRDILELCPHGCINVHASLLPKYRGAAPIQWCIVNGDQTTGMSTMRVNPRMDAGDMLLREELEIRPDDTAGSLHERLAELGATLLGETLDAMADGSLSETPQDESAATYAPKVSKQDGRIDWSLPAVDICNRVRGFNPYPGCYCEVPAGSGKMMRVLRARVEAGSADAAAGSVLATDGEGPLVAAGEGAVRLLEVQPAGKRSMDGAAWLRGYALAEDEQVG